MNSISGNLSSQFDEEGNILVLFDEIAYSSVYGTENMYQDDFIVSKNGGKRSMETTKGWEILIQRKYVSTAWKSMKYIRECYQLQLDKYYPQSKISQ